MLCDSAETAGRRRRQAIMQVHARSPFDVRRLYRRSHPLIPKALGIYAATRVRLHRLTGDDTDRRGAERPLEVLMEDTSAGTPGWGYHWDMQTRWSFYPAGSPNVVVTAFAATGLDEAAQAFGLPHFRDRAAQAAAWVHDELFDPELGIYRYHPASRTTIHNANLLGARLAWRLLGQDATIADAVRSAVERTLAAQRPNGSWPYGDGGRLGFVDSFHTGYVLDCLTDLQTLDPRVREAVEQGTQYYLSSFFGPAGEARLWPDRAFPEDSHAAGTALTSLTSLTASGLADPEMIARVMARATAHMLRGGHAIYRRYRWHTTHVRYLRWADAHLALGFANAAIALGAQPGSPGNGAGPAQTASGVAGLPSPR
jgi:hypothetical protein